ncbi:MAG: RDD family protein [Ideonella sp.]|nr:RDD family protein [Ideonella sp.]MBL0149018.1 RDD family protein [Ideonella sp.]
MAAFVYEGVLLFGVLMIFGYLYSSLTQQRHALQGKSGLQAFLFVILGIYFSWFWSRSGQTLAMKTWHLRVVRSDGSSLTQARALVRYVLAWLWFIPGLAVAHVFQLTSSGQIFGVLALGVALYAGLSRLRPGAQFLHDILCDTRVVWTRPPNEVSAASGR